MDKNFFNNNNIPNYENNANPKNENVISNNSIYHSIAKNAATQQINGFGDWIDRLSKCNFSFIKQHFDVTEDVVKSRIMHSLIPFNPKFHSISQIKPDLYGPLWIFTTLVFIIAASGEITSYFNGALETDYFEQFVPLSALMVILI